MARNLARGTALGFAAQVWQLATALIVFRYLTFALTQAQFGEWRVTLSILNYAELLIVGGIVQVAAKRLAERPDELPRIERSSYIAQAVFAGGLFIGVEVCAGLIAAALRTPALEALIRISALDIPVFAVFQIASSLHLGKQDFVRQVVGMFAYATAKFVAIVALVYIGFSVPGALIGNAVSSVVGFAFLFTPWVKSDQPIRASASEARAMVPVALPFWRQSLAAGFSSDIDLWFVQAIVGSAATGIYGAAAALAEITSFLFAALSRVLFPSVARAGAENKEWLVARYASQAVRLAILVTVLGVAVIAATGGAALALIYEKSYAAGAAPFAALMVAAVGRIVYSTCSDVMMARGHRRLALTIILGTTAAEVVLLFVIVPMGGPLAAAVAAAVAGVAAAVWGCWSLRRLLGWRIVWTLVRSSAAALVVGAALAIWHPHGLILVPAYVIAAVLFTAVLAVLGEFDADDRASLAGVLRRAA